MKLRPLAIGLAVSSLVAAGMPSLASIGDADVGADSYKQASAIIDTTAIGTVSDGFEASRELNMAPVAHLETGATTDMQFQRREGVQTYRGEQVDAIVDLAFLGISPLSGGGEHGLAVVDISDPTNPEQLSFVQCGGFHNDVAVWENYAVIGHDGRAGACPQATENLPLVGPGAPDGAGLWVFDVTDPADPQLVKFFNAEGEGGIDLLRDGTHNFTVHPSGLVYFATASFDADNPGFGWFDLNDMEAGQTVFSMTEISPLATDGCHDIGLSVGNTYFDAETGEEVERDLAVCPAIESTFLWDITDPTDVFEVATIANPAVNIHHGGRFTPDGRTMVLGDELGGAGAPSGCFNGAPVGAMYTYDVSLPEVPILTGYVSASESPGTIETCTSHFYNFVPNAEGRTQVMTGWYGSGMVSHDLTPLVRDGADVVSVTPMGAGPEVAHIEPAGAELWNAYAYRGYVYAGSYTGNTGFYVASLDGYTGTDDALLPPYSVDEGIVWGRWTAAE